jgi:hypothetical protein
MSPPAIVLVLTSAFILLLSDRPGLGGVTRRVVQGVKATGRGWVWGHGQG